ncbi:hypothetical protein EW026_g1732 [Hermanssonia centrifuga]|uniref:CUE domain-containing protein n=1 Tax=Hermanssonia centrifuga TaxID=98765 RepID=A0A4S4KQH9_9APHY|nr:hypothetical protein EW026_g1732 [Hermanssonia centrifuga]
MTVTILPRYPSTRSREALSPSQSTTLNTTISSSLTQIISLPPTKRDTPATITFISTYAKDHAQQILHSLIWGGENDSHLAKLSKAEQEIHQNVLRLAEKLAASLELPVFIDLGVIYGSTNPKRTRALFDSAFSHNASSLRTQLESEAIPAFTSLLSTPSQGLYGLRKIAHVLLLFLKPAPAELIRSFARSKHLVLALANAYDEGLAVVSQSYGSHHLERLSGASGDIQLDDWERIFLETKVALIDSFHILLQTLLKDVGDVDSAGSMLAARCELAFEIVSALLDLQSSRPPPANPTPFLNQTLLEDYQRTYDLARILSRTTRQADGNQLLESALQSLGSDSNTSERSAQAGPGVLKLLIRSSGVPPGIDNLGRGSSRVSAKGKGKAPEVVVQSNPALDAAVAQVLDILSDQDPEYVRFVLSHPDYSFKGNAERLIGALLEGAAPNADEVAVAMAHASEVESNGAVPLMQEAVKPFEYTKERRNVFDDERMDLSQLRVGKKKDESNVVLQDRAFIEQMKADILRRAEEVSDSEEEEEGPGGRKTKGNDLAFEDDLDDEGAVKVRDGDPSADEGSESEDDGDDGDATSKQPETILELAYIRDPKLFDRDAQTKRSKARTDLKAQTGWSDEQIEGWRIMLERNPQKDKLLQKHEFAGIQPGLMPEASSSNQGPRGGGRGRGRGRGGGGGGARGRGRGGGRGGQGGGGGGGGGGEGGSGGDARERAWKDKNKASRGNHNRKRGHDKKMARAGGPS